MSKNQPFEIQQLRAEIESLRQLDKLLEDNLAEKRNECMNLRQQTRQKETKMIKHIPYNPLFYGGSNAGQPSPVELIPEGCILEKVVAITEYEWVLVCRKEEP